MYDKKNSLNCFDPVMSFTVSVPIDDVQLWWPNGFGDQVLYFLDFHLKAFFITQDVNVHQMTESHKSVRIGFRTIELIEEPLGNGNVKGSAYKR